MFVSSTKIDKVNIVSPGNLMLFVFFMRLVISPLTIIFFGYQKWVLPFNPSSFEIYKSYFIVFLAFYSVIIGWDLVSKKPIEIIPDEKKKMFFRNNSIIAILLMVFMILIIFLVYGSFINYINSFYLEDYLFSFSNKNKLLLYLSIIIRYGVPFFGIIFGIFILERINGDVYIKATIAGLFLLLIVFLAFGPSRSNIVFPVLAFLAAVIPRYLKIKFLDFVLGCCAFIIIAFIFQNIRKRSNKEMLNQLNKTEKFVEFIQVYFNAPHIMTPALRIKDEMNEVPFTLPASFLETIPVLGAPFRDRSGSYVYNVAYGRAEGRDQVFPTSGEVYLNLGYSGVIIIFVLIGFFYRKIDMIFHCRTISDPVYRAIIFYLALLYNASIFLSFSVLGQFAFYNSLLIITIMFLRDKQSTKIELDKV